MSNTMTSEDSETPLFAVLIGIDTYKAPHPEFRPLRGSVPDAKEFENYLKGYLNVPNDHIKLLTNELATRFNIIDVLKGVKDDKRIKYDDAIFIYYAGHGTEVEPPKYRANGVEKEIQAIVPYDCDVKDESGKPIPPIADYVLGILLSKIAEQKGNNITVVFDCCHSGSGTRSVRPNFNLTARSVKLSQGAVYSEHLDQDILELETTSRGMSTLPDLSHFGWKSHILLAACGHKQLAHENNGHGRFSAALLNLLKQVPHNMLRYCDVLSHPRLDRIPGQDPQCEGHHADRILFNAKVLPIQRKSFPISFDETGQYIVGGGTIHSITLDSEFEIYRKTDITFSTPIDVLHVADLQELSFTAKIPQNSTTLHFDEPIVAVQTKFGNQVRLRIHIPPQDDFRKIYDTLKENQELKHYFNNIALVDSSEDPDVEIISRAKKVGLKMHAKVIAPDQAGEAASIIRNVEADPKGLAVIFSKMAHFYSESKNSCVNPRISGFVQVEFYELKQESVPDVDTGYEDVVYKQVEPHSNLCIGRKIELPLRDEDEEKPYGLKLVNNSGIDLHANVFHFNNHDLEITPWVTSNHGCTDNGPDTFLKPKGGTLEIGFGTPGYLPQNFKIENGLDTEIGFFKIYLSSRPVDLSYLPQLSPFNSGLILSFQLFFVGNERLPGFTKPKCQ